MSDPVVEPLHRYLFDCQGYVVLRGVLDDAEVARLNDVVDARGVRSDTGDDPGVGDFLLFLGEEFRALLDHPRVLPYLEEWLGDGVRVDHYYPIFSSPSGKTSRVLHGDPRSTWYQFCDGIHSGLTVVSWALADLPPGGDGFVGIPGSHKANYPCPEEIKTHQVATECVQHVAMHAGDALIFTESLTHGTIPWSAAHQRRSFLVKYTPGQLQYSGNQWSEELLELMTTRQRRLFRDAYITTSTGADGIFREPVRARAERVG